MNKYKLLNISTISMPIQVEGNAVNDILLSLRVRDKKTGGNEEARRWCVWL